MMDAKSSRNVKVTEEKKCKNSNYQKKINIILNTKNKA